MTCARRSTPSRRVYTGCLVFRRSLKTRRIIWHISASDYNMSGIVESFKTTATADKHTTTVSSTTFCRRQNILWILYNITHSDHYIHVDTYTTVSSQIILLKTCRLTNENFSDSNDIMLMWVCDGNIKDGSNNITRVDFFMTFAFFEKLLRSKRFPPVLDTFSVIPKWHSIFSSR